MKVRRNRFGIRIMAAVLAVVLCFGEWCVEFQVALAEEAADVSGNETAVTLGEGVSVSERDVDKKIVDISGNCAEQEDISSYADTMVNIMANASAPNFESASYKGSNPFYNAGYNGQCTWYAWGRAHERLGIELPMRGAAGTWYAGASGYYTRGSVPKENSIIVWTGSTDHVAYVEAVNGNKITISEGNYNGQYQWKEWTMDQLEGGYRPGQTVVGYIYLTAGTSDTEKPRISNARITNVTRDGYTVTCNVSDNVGVTEARFPTWRTGVEGECKWLTGTVSGNTASCRINVSDFGSTETTYITHIYVYDAAGNQSEGVAVQQFIDRTAPTITGVKISDVNRDGYTVTCNVSDNVGVTEVRFPTRRTEVEGEWKWYTGTVSGSTASYRVNISDFGSTETTYLTHIYAYDAAGNQSEGVAVQQFIDRTPPTITNVQITNITKDGYTITCTISDNVGVTKVDFPTKMEGESDDKRVWLAGTIDGNQASRRVGAASFGNKQGTYITQIYAYDQAGNGRIYGVIEQFIDRTPPAISDIQFSQIDATGFTISCSITDDSEITSVYFPSWTLDNGQDDLLEDWKNTSRYIGKKEGDRYVCRVENQDHDFATGQYCFNIYAYDSFGNESVEAAEFDYRPDCVSSAEAYYQGHIYQLYDYVLTWEEARKKCEEMGGHLVTVGSAEEQAVVEQMLSGAGRSGYFMGGHGNGRQPAWITGEDFGYTHWNAGWGDNAFQEQYVYEMVGNGYWQLCGKNDTGRGFICEFETIRIDKIEFSEKTIQMQKGETKELHLQVTPDTIKPFEVIWTSSNETVASVEGGIVTAHAGGKAVITAEFQGKRAECQIEVQVRAGSIALNKTTLELVTGDQERLQIIYDPADANVDTAVQWSTDNPAVALVTQGGTVTALSPGTAQITAVLLSDPAATAVCTLQVSGCTVTFDSMGGSYVEGLECVKGDRLTDLPVPEKEGFAFDDWYKDKECRDAWDSAKDTVTGDMTLYAGWLEAHEGFWVKEIPDQTYTGSAIKPAVQVYSGSRRLTLGRDYTVSYKNNKAACDTENAGKAPSVIVKGKGNYKGTETVSFRILKKNLADEDIQAEDLLIAYNGRTQQPLPVVKREKKKLANKKDYQVVFTDLSDGAYQEPGTYEIKIRGVNNYTGVRSITLTIAKQTLISKVSVSKIPDQQYDGTEKQPVPVLKYKGMALTEEDYELTWENNVKAGTATVIIKGKGNYSGTRKINFKIKGASMKNVKVQGIENAVYSGRAVYQSYTLTTDGGMTTLREEEDYTVTYSKNKETGTTVMTFTGINGYMGSIKKTFKIQPYAISENEEGLFTVDQGEISVPYSKGGAKPKPAVWFNGARLEEGKDYSLSYINHQKTGDASSDKAPTIVITGKGNFKGTVSRTFRIMPKDLAAVKVTVKDIVYNPKKNTFQSTPVLTDTDGRKLTAGKDYKKTFEYFHADGTPAGKEDRYSAGMTIRVKIEAVENGSYTGTATAEYKIAQKSIASAKITFKQKVQEYTGEEVEPGPDDIIVKVNGQILTGGKEGDPDADYIIEGYDKNVNKGKAKITIKGVNNYAGTKTARFTIGAKGIQWFWRLLFDT